MVMVTSLVGWLLLASPEPAAPARPPAAPAPAVPTPAVPATGLERIQAEKRDQPVVTLFKVKSEMGNRFRLVEARFVVDGVETVRKVAKPGGELPRELPVIQSALPSGRHVVTAELIFQGRNVGPFSYMDDYRYRVESTVPFETGHLIGPAIVEVVAKERPGATLPLEQKPMLTLTAVNDPTLPEKLAKQPAPPARGLTPASATTPAPAPTPAPVRR